MSSLKFTIPATFAIAASLLYACSGSEMAGSSGASAKKPATPANALPQPSGGPLTPSGVVATPTPSPALGSDIPGLSVNNGGQVLAFSAFRIGVEDRASDPDPFPYGDFSMCFHGQFARRAADQHIVSLTDQLVNFTLVKSSGCGGYTFTLTAGANTQSWPMNSNTTIPVSMQIAKGASIEATIHLNDNGGGCDAGATRVLYGPLTSAVEKTLPDCTK